MNARTKANARPCDVFKDGYNISLIERRLSFNIELMRLWREQVEADELAWAARSNLEEYLREYRFYILNLKHDLNVREYDIETGHKEIESLASNGDKDAITYLSIYYKEIEMSDKMKKAADATLAKSKKDSSKMKDKSGPAKGSMKSKCK